MNFKEAYKAMQEGKKVRRKIWKAYWHYDKKTERCYSHIDDKYSDREGKEIIFDREVKEILFEDYLAEDWEVVEEEKKYWKPKEKEKYFYIEDCIGVSDDRNVQAPIDYCRFNIGNCFKTKEEAEHILEKLKVIHELQKFAYENNEKEIDWNNFSQNKFYLIYDSEVNNILVDYFSSTRTNSFNIYFTSFKIAKRAIEEIGEDRIKKYYFDVEE